MKQLLPWLVGLGFLLLALVVVTISVSRSVSAKNQQVWGEYSTSVQPSSEK